MNGMLDLLDFMLFTAAGGPSGVWVGLIWVFEVIPVLRISLNPNKPRTPCPDHTPPKALQAQFFAAGWDAPMIMGLGKARIDRASCCRAVLGYRF